MLHNLKKKLHLTEANGSPVSQSSAKKATENTLAMKKATEHSELLSPNDTSSKSLRNSFTGQSATPAQEEDLLNFRSIEQADFDTFVEHVYLGASSVQVTTRRHNLKTFAVAKVTKQ